MSTLPFRALFIMIMIVIMTISVTGQDFADNPYMNDVPDIPLQKSDWDVGAGTLVIKNGYGILSASENAGGYLVARAYYKQNFSGFPRYEVSVQFGRLDAEYGHPMELFFLGGAFAIAESGSFYFWEHDGGQFSGWKNSGAINFQTLNTLKVRHLGRNITGYINGVEVGTFQLKRPVGDKRISIYMKGKLTGEPQIVFTNFIVSEIKPELDSNIDTENGNKSENDTESGTKGENESGSENKTEHDAEFSIDK